MCYNSLRGHPGQAPGRSIFLQDPSPGLQEVINPHQLSQAQVSLSLVSQLLPETVTTIPVPTGGYPKGRVDKIDQNFQFRQILFQDQETRFYFICYSRQGYRIGYQLILQVSRFSSGPTSPRPRGGFASPPHPTMDTYQITTPFYK